MQELMYTKMTGRPLASMKSGNLPKGLMRGAAPIYSEEGALAILFLHGFTSSPYEGRFMADYFAGQGVALWAPLMPGHGTDPSELKNVRYQDWVECAEKHLLEMQQRYNKVVICGQSMGGALAVHLAARFTAPALVTLAAAMFVKDWRLSLLPLAERLITYQHKSKGPDIKDPQTKAEIASYNKYPLSSLREFLKLIAEARSLAAKVEIPALFIHSRRDHTITIENQDFLMRTVASARKEMLVLENAYHVLSVDLEREQIFAKMKTFIEDVC